MKKTVGEWIAIGNNMQEVCDATFLEPDIAFKLDDYRRFCGRVHKMAVEFASENSGDRSILEKTATCNVDPFDMSFDEFRGSVKSQLEQARKSNPAVEFSPRWLDAVRYLFEEEDDGIRIE